MIWAGIVGLLAVTEIVLAVTVNRLRKDFQWLITKKDLLPEFNDELTTKYFKSLHDPVLGWLRRPGSAGEDDTVHGKTSYSIDALGRRADSLTGEKVGRVWVFGDSFAFSRMVGDAETWPHYLGDCLGEPVDNFGVGNFGLDQATLRLERELAASERAPDVVVMNIVPDTMARVHSHWKHYYEYGNILAFKPIYKLDGGKLTFHPMPIPDQAHLKNLATVLPSIQEKDIFFEAKFLKDILRFPYTFSFFRRFRRNALIVGYLILSKTIGDASQKWRMRAVNVILAENAKLNRKLYRNDERLNLLQAIVVRFRDVCHAAGATPVLMISPQPADLHRGAGKPVYYKDFFEGAKNLLPVIDLTDMVERWDAGGEAYVYGPMGPHFTPETNRKVAELLAPTVLENLSSENRSEPTRRKENKIV